MIIFRINRIIISTTLQVGSVFWYLQVDVGYYSHSAIRNSSSYPVLYYTSDKYSPTCRQSCILNHDAFTHTGQAYSFNGNRYSSKGCNFASVPPIYPSESCCPLEEVVYPDPNVVSPYEHSFLTPYPILERKAIRRCSSLL